MCVSDPMLRGLLTEGISDSINVRHVHLTHENLSGDKPLALIQTIFHKEWNRNNIDEGVYQNVVSSSWVEELDVVTHETVEELEAPGHRNYTHV